LLIEPAARTRHLNISQLSTLAPLRFHGGRLFGGTRAAKWPAHKRWLYALGSPLIPLVRLRRTLAVIRRSPARRGLLPRILPDRVANGVDQRRRRRRLVVDFHRGLHQDGERDLYLFDCECAGRVDELLDEIEAGPDQLDTLVVAGLLGGLHPDHEQVAGPPEL